MCSRAILAGGAAARWRAARGRQRGPLGNATVARQASLLIQATNGLNAVHDAQEREPAVHRDISPSNLLVGAVGTGLLKLTDFGFAKGAGDAALTATGFYAGTPGCMAPEQIADFANADHRADTFALGRTFAAGLLGVDPRHADPARVTGPLAPLIRGMCELDPAARPQSSEDCLAQCLQLLSAANTVPDDMLVHATLMGIPGSLALWGPTLSQYFSGNLTATHLQLCYDIRHKEALVGFVGADSLFTKLDCGPVESEYSRGAARFDRCDPLAWLYLRLAGHVSAANRLAIFRRLLDVAARHNRFLVMNAVRTLHRREPDPGIRASMEAFHNESAWSQRVLL